MSENIRIEVIDNRQNSSVRRIYYIDTGDMPAEKAMIYLEKIKKEISEK